MSEDGPDNPEDCEEFSKDTTLKSLFMPTNEEDQKKIIYLRS